MPCSGPASPEAMSALVASQPPSSFPFAYLQACTTNIDGSSGAPQGIKGRPLSRSCSGSAPKHLCQTATVHAGGRTKAASKEGASRELRAKLAGAHTNGTVRCPVAFFSSSCSAAPEGSLSTEQERRDWGAWVRQTW